MPKPKTAVLSEIDPSGSTQKVSRKKVQLAYRKKVTIPSATPGQPGTRGTENGFITLAYSEKLVDYFNIPAATGTEDLTSQSVKKIAVKAYSYTKFLTIDGSETKTINQSAGERQQQVKSGAANNTKAAVITLDKLTAKGRPRTIHFAFPVWFTVPMISQALGSMLRQASADRKPSMFKMAGSGAYYLINYAASDGAPADGFDNGAWITTATPSETDAQPTGIVSSAGDRTTSNNQTSGTP